MMGMNSGAADTASGLLVLLSDPVKAGKFLAQYRDAVAANDEKAAQARKAQADAEASLKALAEKEPGLQRETAQLVGLRSQLAAERAALDVRAARLAEAEAAAAAVIERERSVAEREEALKGRERAARAALAAKARELFE